METESSPLTPVIHVFPYHYEKSAIKSSYETHSPDWRDDYVSSKRIFDGPVFYRGIQNAPMLQYQEGLPYGEIVEFFRTNVAVILCQGDIELFNLWSDVVPKLAANEPLLANCIVAYTALIMNVSQSMNLSLSELQIQDSTSHQDGLDDSPEGKSIEAPQREVSQSTLKKLTEIAFATYSHVLDGLSSAMGHVSIGNALSMYFSGMLIAAFSLAESPPVALKMLENEHHTTSLDGPAPLPDVFEILRGTYDLCTLVYPHIYKYTSLLTPLFPFQPPEEFSMKTIKEFDISNDDRLNFFVPIFHQIAHMELGNGSLCASIVGEKKHLTEDTAKVIYSIAERAFESQTIVRGTLEASDNVFSVLKGELESATLMTFLIIHYYLKSEQEGKPTTLWCIFRDASPKFLELLRSNRQLPTIILAYICSLFEMTQYYAGPTFIRCFTFTQNLVSTEWKPALFWPLRYFNMGTDMNDKCHDPWLSTIGKGR